MTKGLTDAGWNLMCNVDRIIIDAEHRCGYVYLPEDNYPDMTSTINCFLSADPVCECIYTFVNNKPDTAYVLVDGKWESRYGWAK